MYKSDGMLLQWAAGRFLGAWVARTSIRFLVPIQMRACDRIKP